MCPKRALALTKCPADATIGPAQRTLDQSSLALGCCMKIKGHEDTVSIGFVSPERRALKETVAFIKFTGR